MSRLDEAVGARLRAAGPLADVAHARARGVGVSVSGPTVVSEALAAAGGPPAPRGRASRPSAASELAEAELAATFRPEDAVPVAGALGYVRDLGLWRAAGARSWEDYCEKVLLVAAPLVDATVEAGEAWRCARLLPAPAWWPQGYVEELAVRAATASSTLLDEGLPARPATPAALAAALAALGDRLRAEEDEGDESVVPIWHDEADDYTEGLLG